MKELELKYNGMIGMGGFTFSQINKTEKAYIYKVDKYNVSTYEVFERREQKESDRKLGDAVIHYEEKVIYPKINDFGKWAWCFSNYEQAMKKFEDISLNKK